MDEACSIHRRDIKHVQNSFSSENLKVNSYLENVYGWEDSMVVGIRMNLKEARYNEVRWVHLARNRNW